MEKFNSAKGPELPEFLCVQLNGNTDKKNAIKVRLSQTTTDIEDLIKDDIIKKHMKQGKAYPNAKLYSKNGIELSQSDLAFLKTGDFVYLARNGEKFDYQQMMQRYEKVKILGQGGFGKVYLMRDTEKENEQYYAVKFINMTEYFQKADLIQEIDREAKTLRMLNSKYIIQLENYFILNKEIILVMEYAEGGIIHRDLKLENVLFEDKDHKMIKIVDFGIAGFCLNNLKEKTDAGTYKYMAPEVLTGQSNLANPAMDIWALGIMMFVMLYGFHPFLSKVDRFNKDYDLKKLILRICQEPLVIPKHGLKKSQDDEFVVKLQSGDLSLITYEIPIISEPCKDLLHQLLNKSQKDRLQLVDAQYHPWFEMTDDEIHQNHNQVQSAIIQAILDKEEDNKQKFISSIQKRNTLAVTSLNNFNNNNLLRPPGGLKSPMVNKRRQGALTPVEIIKQGKEEAKEKKSLGIGKKRVSQFDIQAQEDKPKAISPLQKRKASFNYKK